MKSISLSPVDLVFTGRDAYAVEFLFYYPYPIDARRLQKALKNTIARFWPLGSTLVADDRFTYRLDCASPRIDFEVLPTRSEIPDFENPIEVAPFTETVATIPGEPLAKFRLTRTGSGTTFSASISHCLVDGYSYFFFLSALTAAFRSRPWHLEYWKQRAIRPDHDRTKLRPSEFLPSDDTSAIDPESVFLRTGLALENTRHLPSLKESKWEFVRFGREELSALLKNASRETTVRLSKHDLVTATLWKRFAERWHDRDEMLECSSAFDYRRVFPSLSPLYFGNAIRAAPTRLLRSEVLSLSTSELANRVRLATRRIDAEAVLDSLRCLEKIRRTEGLDGLQKMHVSHPAKGLLVTNLSRVPISRLDFGRGGPERFVALTPAPRAALIVSEGNDLVARVNLPDLSTVAG